MHKKKSRTIKIIYSSSLIIALLSGIIIGKVINWPFFKVDERVNLVDIFSIIITLIIAYFIAKVIEKEKEDDRAEKNLIISKLTCSSNTIDDLSDQINKKEILYIDATSKIKKINLDITCAFNGLKISTVTLENDERVEINKKIKKIKDLITDTPLSNQNKNESIKVENGVIKISNARAIEIESELGKLKNEIFLLQMKINSF